MVIRDRSRRLRSGREQERPPMTATTTKTGAAINQQLRGHLLDLKPAERAHPSAMWGLSRRLTCWSDPVQRSRTRGSRVRTGGTRGCPYVLRQVGDRTLAKVVKRIGVSKSECQGAGPDARCMSMAVERTIVSSHAHMGPSSTERRVPSNRHALSAAFCAASSASKAGTPSEMLRRRSRCGSARSIRARCAEATFSAASASVIGSITRARGSRRAPWPTSPPDRAWR